jgi:nitrogen fixation NifU-like protein
MNARDMYQAVILDHNRKPRNFRVLPHASHHAEGVNPLCGDRLTLALSVVGDRVEDLAFTGDSCAICKASASMMTVAVKGRTCDEATRLAAAFRAMAMGPSAAADTERLGRLAVFAGIAQLPGRVKCAVLPWHTLTAALAGERAATAEPDAASAGLAP